MPNWSSDEHRKNWIASRTRPAEERFRTKVRKTRGCWLWTGATNLQGYGVFGRGNRAAGNVLAHRFAWELEHGPIPAGMCVLHRCDRPLCVKTAHLFLGTQQENLADMRAKHRDRPFGK